MTSTPKSILISGLAVLSICLSIHQSNAQSLPPVETQKPNSDYKSAFAGQTRVKGTQTKTKLNVTVINHELKSPFSFTLLS